MRPSPPNPAKFRADIDAAIQNLYELRRLYPLAHKMSQEPERHGGLGSHSSPMYLDDGTPAKSAGETAFNLMPLRDSLRVVADIIEQDKTGVRARTGSALTDLRSILDRGRHVSPDWEVKPGEYATTPEHEKRIRESNIAKTGGRR